MIRSLIQRGGPFLQSTVKSQLVSQRQISRSSLLKSEFDDLKKIDATPVNQRSSTVFDIDELISKSPGLQDSYSRANDDLSLGNSTPDPREVAKSINIFGPSSGRTVDVKYNNLGYAIGNVFSVLKSNNIRQQYNFQKRYIRPAKYQKEKKRLWWRKQFAKGFSGLMGEISDAKRRGY